MPGSDLAARGRALSNPIAIGRYALAWIGVVALVAGLTGFLLREPRPAPKVDPVTLAAAEGGCVMRTDAGGASPGALDVMQPPTFGPPAAPAATGVYRHAPRTAAVVGSLRRGTVVLQYRRTGTSQRVVRKLRRMFGHAPFASIVTPDRTGMRYAVAATAWGRLLGCPHATGKALAAMQAFALRYRGRGPDAPR